MGKKGPPYLNNPHATFLVIDHPWGQTAERNSQAFINHVGAWVRFMTRSTTDHDLANQAEHDILVEKIYTRKNEDIIIVELPENTPLAPYLGEHLWNEFLKPYAHKKYPHVSLIFEYNYRNNGDPSNHNWTEHYPTAQLPPPNFPVQVPYPPPRYATKTGTLAALTKSMPQPPQPQQDAPPISFPGKLEVEDVKTFVKTEHVKTEDMSRYEPRDELHALVTTYNSSRAGLSSATTTSGSQQKRLVSPSVRLEQKDVKPFIKTEDKSRYEPQDELIALVTAYDSTRAGPSSATVTSRKSQNMRKRLQRSKSPPIKSEEDTRVQKKMRVKGEHQRD